MGDKVWKAFERWVGKNIFDGAPRNMGSGAVNKDDEGNGRPGDLIHPKYQVECKLRSSMSIFRWWDKLKDEAIETGKLPVLVMREKGDAQDVLVTIHYSLFNEMKEAWEEKEDVK